jgi:drug/metabolite transporter (DMT)-like permease
VLFPIVTMLLGAWLADEPLTATGVFGAAVVMSGVWFGALAPAARRPMAVAPHEAPAPATE